MVQRRILLGAGLALGMGGGRVKAADADALYRQALAAARRAGPNGDVTEALALATQLVQAEPNEVRGRHLRARLYTLRGDHGKAAADYGTILRRHPNVAEVWQERGEAHFRLGKFAESVSDFDRFLQLKPDEKPHHWQRGISLYYAGRFADGKAQFTLHQTVNTNDVENAVWHFLCCARAEGQAAARKQLIPIQGDPRVPMAQIHRLFSGQGSRKEVLDAANAADPRPGGGEPLFYAYLYLALYHDAIGEKVQAKEDIRQAVARARTSGYMGDVARVHARALKV